MPCPCCSVCCAPRLAPLPLLSPPLRLSACPRVRSPRFCRCPPLCLSARASFGHPSCPRPPAALLPCASLRAGSLFFVAPPARLPSRAPVCRPPVRSCLPPRPPALRCWLVLFCSAALPATHPAFFIAIRVLRCCCFPSAPCVPLAVVWLRGRFPRGFGFWVPGFS